MMDSKYTYQVLPVKHLQNTIKFFF